MVKAYSPLDEGMICGNPLLNEELTLWVFLDSNAFRGAHGDDVCHTLTVDRTLNTGTISPHEHISMASWWSWIAETTSTLTRF